MITRKLLVLASTVLIAIAGFTSCNKENGGGGEEADKVVGKFEITDATSPIKSIELTAEGDYIITKNPSPAVKSSEDLDLSDVWLYGNFTFANGTYFLQGFGKIVIDMLSGGSAEILINSGGWDPFTVHANVAANVSKTPIDKSLCRHWVFNESHFTISSFNKTFVDIKVGGCNFSTWFRDTRDPEADNLEEECTGIIFTESGTYAVIFGSGKVNVGTWAWDKSENGSLKCDWSNEYKSFFKDYRFGGSLVVDVQEGDPSTCTITRSFESSWYNFFSAGNLKTSLVYYLTEYRD